MLIEAVVQGHHTALALLAPASHMVQGPLLHTGQVPPQTLHNRPVPGRAMGSQIDWNLVWIRTPQNHQVLEQVDQRARPKERALQRVREPKSFQTSHRKAPEPHHREPELATIQRFHQMARVLRIH
jgi:hypothetical protein